jgi:hypothetical protein
MGGGKAFPPGFPVSDTEDSFYLWMSATPWLFFPEFPARQAAGH